MGVRKSSTRSSKKFSKKEDTTLLFSSTGKTFENHNVGDDVGDSDFTTFGINQHNNEEDTIYEFEGKLFKRLYVRGDGDCGFTAFGITRQQAIHLLLEKIANNQQVARLLQQPLREVMFQKGFRDYLAQRKIFTDYTTTFDQLTEAETMGNTICANSLRKQLDEYVEDINFLSCYISYDLVDKKVDDGWTHPSVLQALAEIRDLRLNIYTHICNQEEHDYLIPHTFYPTYPKNEEIKQEINLLFINNNHFDLLDLLPERRCSKKHVSRYVVLP